MDFKNSNHQSQSSLSYSKNSKAFSLKLLTWAGIFITLIGCSSKRVAVDVIYFDSLEGEIHQLTNVGENTESYFSPTFNKLLFIRYNPQENKTAQVYEKNMVSKVERRITFNLGENHNPQFHPTKPWIIYSSSADELIEKVNVIPTMRNLGLQVPEEKANKDVPQEIYISAEDGSDLKRITREKGFDGLANFSKDGEKIYYVKRSSQPQSPSQSGSQSQIIAFDLKNGQKKVLATEKSKILSLSVSKDLIAWTSKSGDDNQKLVVKKIKNNEVVFEGSDKYNFSDVKLHPQEMRLLVISNIEDLKNKDVYQIDLGEKCATRFSFHAADESSPTFGPEGKSLFYVSNRSKTNQIYATLIRPSLGCKPLE